MYSNLYVEQGSMMHLGLKVKIDYFVLDAKLLLININYVKIFKQKNFDKIFHTY